MSRNRRKGSANPGRAGDALVLKTDRYANAIIKSSRQLTDFRYGDGIIKPPYEPGDLIALIERSDTLKQNIEAMAVNVANFGHAIRYQNDFDYNKASAERKRQANREWDTLRRLYKFFNPLSDFSSLIYKMAVDMYSIGWGMLEIIRDGAGRARSVEYCRACNFRLVSHDGPPAAVMTWEETENGYEQTELEVRFKKFVQISGNKRVYFKEFGDRRPMSFITGQYGGDIPEEERATELAYFAIHSSYSDYGVPYWINTAISASGSVLSELLNYKYFQDGRILPLAVLVSGGQLTEGSVQAIANSRGMDNAYKALVLEASPFDEGDDKRILGDNSNPRVNIDIKQLADTSNPDALFRSYQRDGHEKMRDSMRLPPIFTGATSDYNRATADTARTIAEDQIFVPERKRICDIFNKIINNELAIHFCELYLKGPNLSDLSQKVGIISALNRAGAVTPNMLLPVVEEALGRDIELWNETMGNIPFELLKLRGADD